VIFTPELFANAIVAGLLLGGFYAAVALGLSIAFGQLDIVNIAHPAFVVVGAYTAYIVNSAWGVDPILIGLVVSPIFFVAGAVIYRIYFQSFERTGQESLRGLVFFFGIMFIIEVLLILAYGVDYRFVRAPYIGLNWKIGPIDLPLRMVVPFVVALAMTAGITFYLSNTFIGRAIKAVAQDRVALQLMGASPIKIKQYAFGLAIATAAIAGPLLIIIGPVEPSIGRAFIGRVFAIVVLGGMGSISGTLIAALILGVAESLVATFYGPTWSNAVAFSILLITLAVRPQGLFGRI
jgi:branched-chain amino acid transport system permease protein